jgi:hypothetical protein
MILDEIYKSIFELKGRYAHSEVHMIFVNHKTYYEMCKEEMDLKSFGTIQREQKFLGIPIEISEYIDGFSVIYSLI